MKAREIGYPEKVNEQITKFVTLKGALVDKLPKKDPVATILVTGDDPKAGKMHAMFSLPPDVKVHKPKKGDGGFSSPAAMIHKIVAIVESYKIVDVSNIEIVNDNVLKVEFTVDKAASTTDGVAFADIKKGLQDLVNRHNAALGGDPVDDADDADDDADDSTDPDDDADDDDDNTDDNTDDSTDDDNEPDPFAEEDEDDEEEITLESGKGVTGLQFTGTDEEVLNLQRSSAEFYAKLQGICGRKTTVTLPNGEVYKSDSNS